MSKAEQPQVIKVDEVPFYWLGEKDDNSMRRIKVVLSSKNMKVHVGIFPGKQSSSKHSHETSEEVVYVIKGEGEVTLGDKVYKIGPNTLVFAPPGVPHQYRNTGEEELMLIAIYSPPTELPGK